MINERDSAIICCAFTALLRTLPIAQTDNLSDIVMKAGSDDLKKSLLNIVDLNVDLLQHLVNAISTTSNNFTRQPG